MCPSLPEMVLSMSGMSQAINQKNTPGDTKKRTLTLTDIAQQKIERLSSK